MSRLFRRGELKAALLDALDRVEPANGYAVMQSLAEGIGGGWQPSPGAVYPALLALEDAGLISARDHDGSKLYALTASGRRRIDGDPGVLSEVAARSRSRPAVTPRLGTLLTRFAAETPHRSAYLDEHQHRAVDQALDRLSRDIHQIINGRT